MPSQFRSANNYEFQQRDWNEKKNIEQARSLDLKLDYKINSINSLWKEEKSGKTKDEMAERDKKFVGSVNCHQIK